MYLLFSLKAANAMKIYIRETFTVCKNRYFRKNTVNSVGDLIPLEYNIMTFTFVQLVFRLQNVYNRKLIT